jgi:hypothetical protein
MMFHPAVPRSGHCLVPKLWLGIAEDQAYRLAMAQGSLPSTSSD